MLGMRVRNRLCCHRYRRSADQGADRCNLEAQLVSFRHNEGAVSGYVVRRFSSSVLLRIGPDVDCFFTSRVCQAHCRAFRSPNLRHSAADGGASTDSGRRRRKLRRGHDHRHRCRRTRRHRRRGVLHDEEEGVSEGES